MSRRSVLALLLALSTVACVAPGASTEGPAPTVGLQEPTFEPLTNEPSSTPSSTPMTSPPVTEPDTPTEDPATATTPEPTATRSSTDEPAGVGTTSPATDTAPPAPVTGTLTDGTGDLRGLEAARAPGHADLRQVSLTMGPDQGRITVAFADPAPDAGRDDEILNVATYHDVTGDGRVDYEIWASMTANGWGTSWFDLRAGTARYAADDEVEVAVEDGVVVLTFPPSHLDGARSGQWLASSEWGTALTISSGTSATDDVPDDRSGAGWPD